ncbi:hypothetical protein EPN83_02845 [Patescibacteria group bacterium]|nr:MAG: hypothetical protein EPN83_02845 [Patescibacteria group bacterium]
MACYDILNGLNMQKVFIHTNNKQKLGAILAKYAIERNLPANSDTKIEILNVDNISAFREFAGKAYLRAGRLVKYNPNDLQSFTLSRFMPPELTNYSGRSVVIDPDIFATQDVSPIFDIDLKGNSVAVCRKKDAWDTSVMLMDCAKLQDWNIKNLLGKLERKELDYSDLMSLRNRNDVLEIPRVWNSLDTLTPETKMLHTTNRLTQPWRTGLPIDFTINPLPKLLGIIPREPIHKLLGKYPTHYQPHPDKKIEQFFFNLVKGALQSDELSRDFIRAEINRGDVRGDLLEKVA